MVDSGTKSEKTLGSCRSKWDRHLLHKHRKSCDCDLCLWKDWFIVEMSVTWMSYLVFWSKDEAQRVEGSKKDCRLAYYLGPAEQTRPSSWPLPNLSHRQNLPWLLDWVSDSFFSHLFLHKGSDSVRTNRGLHWSINCGIAVNNLQWAKNTKRVNSTWIEMAMCLSVKNDK